MKSLRFLFLAATLCLSQAEVAVASVFSPVSHEDFSSNMTVVAVVRNGDVNVAGAEVAAFVGSQCRADGFADADGFVFLTIPGDNTEALSFSVVANGVTYSTVRAYTFSIDAIVGSYDAPFVLQLSSDPVYFVSDGYDVASSAEVSGDDGSQSGSGNQSGSDVITPDAFSVNVDVSSFSGNMTVYGLVRLGAGFAVGAQVAVVDEQGDVRAVQSADSEGYVFLTIPGSSSTDLLSVSIAYADSVYSDVMSFYFEDDKMLGDADVPFVFQLSSDVVVEPYVDPDKQGLELFATLVCGSDTLSRAYVEVLSNGSVVASGYADDSGALDFDFDLGSDDASLVVRVVYGPYNFLDYELIYKNGIVYGSQDARFVIGLSLASPTVSVSDSDVFVYDLSGRLRARSVSNLPRGLYVVKYRSSDGFTKSTMLCVPTL